MEYKGNQKFVWVPVKHAEPKSVESSVDLIVSHSLKRAEHQTAECVVSNPETHEFDRSVSGSGQGKGAGTEGRCVDNILFASSSTRTSLESESANVHSDLVMRGHSSEIYENVPPPMGFKSSTIQRWLSSNRTSQKIKASSVSNQQKIFSAKEKLFAPGTTVSQYRLRNLGGNGIKSVAHGTKPGPQWCSTGITPTQKRRLHRLRASEIREEIAEKNNNVWFNKHRPMVPPKMTWKKKVYCDRGKYKCG
jgi:hypothetical protein